MYRVALEQFEGPLDVLLNFIEKEKLDIAEISLAKVTDEYLQYMKALPEADTARSADFLVVAAQLILIKSRSLLPKLEITPEEEIGILELQTRLRELQILKQGALSLKKLARGKAKSHSRDSHANIVATFYPPEKMTRETLWQKLREMLTNVVTVEKLKQETIKIAVSFETTLASMQKRFTKIFNDTFSSLVGGAKSKMEVIVTFLALLELVRQKTVSVEQEAHFSDITIQKSE